MNRNAKLAAAAAALLTIGAAGYWQGSAYLEREAEIEAVRKDLRKTISSAAVQLENNLKHEYETDGVTYGEVLNSANETLDTLSGVAVDLETSDLEAGERATLQEYVAFLEKMARLQRQHNQAAMDLTSSVRAFSEAVTRLQASRGNEYIFRSAKSDSQTASDKAEEALENAKKASAAFVNGLGEYRAAFKDLKPKLEGVFVVKAGVVTKAIESAEDT